jgi:hypothetical protein
VTANRTRKTTTKRPGKQPTDRQPPAEATDTEPGLTEDDYKVDAGRVLPLMGIDPHTVIDDSVKVAMVSGVLVLEYAVRRAIPPRVMGMALIRATMDQTEEEADGDG